MLRTRLIPVLLLQNRGLVKTVQFKNGKYIGDPINAIKIFNDKECDELILLDIDASKERRGPDFEYLKSLSSECFMPLAYGGGITSIDHMEKLFSLGIEKVILNSSALNKPEIIIAASAKFGNQSIVLSLDLTKNILGKYAIYSHSKAKHMFSDYMEVIRMAQQNGIGEIMINSVDRDGTMQGYDLKLIQKISNEVKVPLICCGGAGKLEDFKMAAINGASGVAAGSYFVYHGPHKAVLINYPKYNELTKLFEKNYE